MVALLPVITLAQSSSGAPAQFTYPDGAKAPAKWTVEPEALVRIGGSAGTGPTEFSGVLGFALDRSFTRGDGANHAALFAFTIHDDENA